MTKRSIVIKTKSGDTELPLSKVTLARTDKQMIHIDQLPDGTWRMIYNESLIPNISEVEGFLLLRE